jgi:hypothetical protein
LGLDKQCRKKIQEVIMVDRFLRVLAALGFALFSFALPASAQDTTRIRGMVERIEGPIFVVKTRDGSEVKLTVTDSPLFVVIVPLKIIPSLANPLARTVSSGKAPFARSSASRASACARSR